MSLEQLSYDYSTFLDKTTILYGASGSGKSTLLFDALWNLNNHAKQIVVVCPTDRMNHTYSGFPDKPGVVPAPLVHDAVSETLLISIWKRQELLAGIYTKANQLPVLEQLFNKLRLADVAATLERANMAKAGHIADANEKHIDPNARQKTIAEIEEKFEKFYRLTYKKYINQHAQRLEAMPLTPDEEFTLRFRNFNPRMVLVFDDCSADFKKIQSSEGKSVLRKMFFQNRWVFLTILVCLHDDKLMDSELRKNAYVSIFTTPQAVYSFFKRNTNGFDKVTADKALAHAKAIFREGSYEKLAFIRMKNEFYRTTATNRSSEPFRFGAASLWRFCEEIKPNNTTEIDKSNEFWKYFNEQ